MNQILETNLNRNKKIKKLLELKNVLRLQLIFSIVLIIFIGAFLIYNTFKLYKQEHYSSKVLDNYNITRLYSGLSSNTIENSDEDISNSVVIGIIEIPKIDVYYPIFSNCDDNLLKIAPCKFYGPVPGKQGNLCIAGHNYNNTKFFSKISYLNINDEVIIYDNSNTKFSYFVFDIYEVVANDLSPVYSYDSNSTLLTLVTCNNLNNNRIIVRALYKK